MIGLWNSKPYYERKTAFARGADVGAAAGMLAAVGAVFMGFGPGGLEPNILSTLGTVVAGGVGGYALGGTSFYVANNVIRLIPGATYLTGEDKAPVHLAARDHSIRTGEFIDTVTREEMDAIEQANEFGGVSARDRIEAQRLAQEAMMGRG